MIKRRAVEFRVTEFMRCDRVHDDPILTQFMTHDKPLVLVDGSSYLFRAFHALPALTTSDGYPTGAIRGVIGMLRKLAKDYAGSPIAVVFDAKGRSFRNELFADYKANRPSMPDDLRKQIAPIHDIIRAMGLPLLIIDGVEADDVIGTLAREATATKRDVVISTSDKDIAQLVSEHVTLIDTMTDTRLDRDGVIAKFGVPPERIIDYLALMGDTSDNIPGVPKVGPKTAAKWIGEYGSLEEVIAHAQQIGGKVGENLRASLAMLPLSKQLTTIKCDVNLSVGIDQLIPDPVDVGRLRQLFEQYEFRPWLEELPKDDATGAAPRRTRLPAGQQLRNDPRLGRARRVDRAHSRSRASVARHGNHGTRLHAVSARRHFVCDRAGSRCVRSGRSYVSRRAGAAAARRSHRSS